jgi:hypothetical protein
LFSAAAVTVFWISAVQASGSISVSLELQF